MNALEVIKAGILTTIQDRGRNGYMDYGITKSGVMDLYAYKWLNKLLDNSKNTNCLEVNFGNVEFKSTITSYIAITGAKCEFSINDETKESWKVYKINAADCIKIGKILIGTKVYFGVKGGFDVEKELNSCSSSLKEQIGKDQLKNGELLKCNSYNTLALKKLKSAFIPNYEEELTLRVILGYQKKSFSHSEKEKFFNSTYTITNQFNKMGCKLKGEKINSNLNGIISEAISYGAIQIPKDGQPIILLNERQTIGGYPKVGSVIPIDCYKLSQRTVNTKIKFQKISLEEAVELQKRFEISFS